MINDKEALIMQIRDFLKSQVLLFDGAMGTWYADSYRQSHEKCELANLSHPDRILRIHKEYIEAGARALRTNTFNAYPDYLGSRDYTEIIREGWALASLAASQSDDQVYVFADIGPAPGKEDEEITKKYAGIVREFLDCGATNFIFETLSSDSGIFEAARMIRQEVPDAFLIASFGIQPDGFSREGIHFKELFRDVEASGLFDVAGLNCVSGARHMTELLEQSRAAGIPLSILPNAGYPEIRENRTYYEGNPEYFALQLKSIADSGVSIIGGCCGTTPRHISCIASALRDSFSPGRILSPAALKNPFPVRPPRVTQEALREFREPHQTDQSGDGLWQKLERGDLVIAAELDPPETSELQKYMAGVTELREAGADAITIADCPIARARLDSSILACKIRRELGMDVLPHMTCRDRNINAIKALLLGLKAENVNSVLIITGDPIPSADRDEVRSVYQFNSVKLASYIRTLNEECFADPIHVFGALNLNAVNFDAEISKAKKKEAAGIYGFLTQPVLSEKAVENLAQARKELTGKLLGGILPVISERNALFMDNEINGISVSEEIIRLYHGKTREEAEELAFTLSCRIAERIRPSVDGFYLMTPFSRTGLTARIIRKIR